MRERAAMAGLALACLLWAPAAQAYTFSFGDSIAATDDISSITLAADDGTGGSTFVFSTATNTLTFTSSVSQINFTNRASITGIPTGALVFTSVVSLNGAFTFAGTSFTAAHFNNGAADFTIWDDPTGSATMVLAGEYDGDGLLVTVRKQVSLAVGELSGDYSIVGGNADVVAAHKPTGSLDQVFTIGNLLGADPILTLCGVVVRHSVLPQCLTGPNDWVDFEASPTSTLIPNAVVPEPSAAVLVLVALTGLGAARRRR